jgi:hypothetical protein
VTTAPFSFVGSGVWNAVEPGSGVVAFGYIVDAVVELVRLFTLSTTVATVMVAYVSWTDCQTSCEARKSREQGPHAASACGVAAYWNIGVGRLVEEVDSAIKDTEVDSTNKAVDVDPTNKGVDVFAKGARRRRRQPTVLTDCSDRQRDARRK